MESIDNFKNKLYKKIDDLTKEYNNQLKDFINKLEYNEDNQKKQLYMRECVPIGKDKKIGKILWYCEYPPSENDYKVLEEEYSIKKPSINYCLKEKYKSITLKRKKRSKKVYIKYIDQNNIYGKIQLIDSEKNEPLKIYDNIDDASTELGRKKNTLRKYIKQEKEFYLSKNEYVTFEIGTINEKEK